ncbi:MAG: VCBS repeat-containing protein [Planctomycetota bacterium]|nr:MAG: VCBS repeat-containing protein [Planctomycetota bacterium]
MDWDGDGDWDLVVACPDVPMRGIYLFENRSGAVASPVFERPVRIGDSASTNMKVSFVDGRPRVLKGNVEFTGFLGRSFDQARTVEIYPRDKIHRSKGNQRFNVWSYVDWEGDGDQDLIVGCDDWGYYGWDDGYDAQGRWRRGPLHGVVYLIENIGSTDRPSYAPPQQLEAGGEVVNVYGNPMPNLADFDGDGDLDLVCGEFLDGFTWFENIGNRSQPEFAAGRRLVRDGRPLHMHVQMITPTAIDWDRDGNVDLVCGDEDGRVAWLRNTGVVLQGMPQFDPPAYFQQRAGWLKFGALVTPVGVDWDGDGDEDLVCGNTAGNIGVFENLGPSSDGSSFPRWAPPVLVKAGGNPLRLMAGQNGSIQGPAEAKWGYTTLSVADWDHDGLHDLVVNSIWGRVVWFRNVGSRERPEFSAEQAVEVLWQGPAPKPPWVWWDPQPHELVTQWRTTPVVVDWDGDGLNDLVMLDHEGYLALFQRVRQGDRLWLLPGRRIFRGKAYDSRHRQQPSADDGLLRLNTGIRGSSGRRKLCVVDWDGDGLRDLMVNSTNCAWLRNTGGGPAVAFEDRGDVDGRRLAGHTTSPTTVDWDGDGWRDLVLGAEDGRLYYLPNPHAGR